MTWLAVSGRNQLVSGLIFGKRQSRFSRYEVRFKA